MYACVLRASTEGGKPEDLQWPWKSMLLRQHGKLATQGECPFELGDYDFIMEASCLLGGKGQEWRLVGLEPNRVSHPLAGLKGDYGLKLLARPLPLLNSAQCRTLPTLNQVCFRRRRLVFIQVTWR